MSKQVIKVLAGLFFLFLGLSVTVAKIKAGSHAKPITAASIRSIAPHSEKAPISNVVVYRYRHGIDEDHFTEGVNNISDNIFIVNEHISIDTTSIPFSFLEAVDYNKPVKVFLYATPLRSPPAVS